MIKVMPRESCLWLKNVMHLIACGLFSKDSGNGLSLIQFVIDGCKAKTATSPASKDVTV